MSITKTLLAGAAGLMLASGVAAANEPTKLSPAEMDQVTAGFFAGAATSPWLLLGVAAEVNTSSFADGFATVSQGSSNVLRTKIGATAAAEASGFAIGIPIVGGEEIFGEVSGNFPGGFAQVNIFQ